MGPLSDLCPTPSNLFNLSRLTPVSTPQRSARQARHLAFLCHRLPLPTFCRYGACLSENPPAAAKLVLAYAIGKPETAVDPDRLDIEEWQTFKDSAGMIHELPDLVQRPDPELPLTVLRATRPSMTRQVGRRLHETLQEPQQPSPRPRSRHRQQTGITVVSSSRRRPLGTLGRQRSHPPATSGGCSRSRHRQLTGITARGSTQKAAAPGSGPEAAPRLPETP
jgi:hypothetical protein